MALLNRIVFGFLLMIIGHGAFAQSTLQLINKEQTIRLSEKVKILPEQGTQLTIDQVRQRKQDFRWLPSSNPNYGLHDGGIWLHTRFSRVIDIQEWVIDIGFAQVDHVDFYLLNGNQIIAFSQQGKLSRSQNSRYPSIKVNIPLATPIDLFVRLESIDKNIIAPLDIQPFEKYLRSSFWDSLLWGFFYGGLLILAIYNLVLYVSNREVSLLAYVGYIVSAVVWQFVWGGHSVMLLPYGVTLWLSNHMDLIFVFIGIASGVFTYSFLDAKHTAPKTASYIKVNIGLLAVMGFCSLINLFPVLWQNALVYISSLVAITSYLVAGFESYANNFRPARYFIFAWSILFLTAIAGMLSLTGILPTNEVTAYCFQIGVFVEAGLFSLAIMDKSHSQLESDIQQATNDIRNNMEFIEEQNVRLDIARKDAINASTIKSQFLANMSHEIRTPLNAILGFSKELIHTPLPVDKQEHVRIINSAADTLLNIVNDVLDVSKIEAGKLQINSQPFSPNELLEEMVSVMAKSAHQKNLEFHFELAKLPQKLIGDAQRIKQVLTNLLGNALKFTPSGHISLHAQGKELNHGLFELKFSIEDTGIGISQQDRKKLFSAFSQIDDATSRSYQGTGLGLMICQKLVRLMGGKITLNSKPGKGSCFTVTVLTNVLNINDENVQNIGWNKKPILILNTDSTATMSTIKMLEHVGAEVTLVDEVADLKRLKHKYSIIFVCLPHHYLQQNEKLFNDIINTKIDNLVFLYSGPELMLEDKHQDLAHIVKLRLPMTVNKLASLTDTPEETKYDQLHHDLLKLPPIKVLAVDDMEMNLRLLSTWLKPSKIDLRLSYTGEDAVKLCKEQEFDLILMDVQMPNMDGLQASKLIRKTQLNIGTPIIAVTAHALKEEQERLLASGMDDYLPKPLDLSDLVALIQRWCNDIDLVEEQAASIDWDLALERANHNKDAAKEVFTGFVNQLPELKLQIAQSWEKQDTQNTQALIHKLHGACCYTGVPILRDLCDELETALKQHDYQVVESRLTDFLHECDLILEQSVDYL
ncbi:hybrid sensor histidine kinase/response regulator [Aliiglaciecola litoralis]|uniref:histidine kinase n=1 Tax=Aliiglaciecola litoralis TaxID=582857 RepID=A0ABP3WT76_9ALTE